MARRIVVKIGTAVLTGGGTEINRAYVHDLAAQIATIRASGRSVLIVSSGAVGAGVGALGLPGRPTDLAQLQAAAATGQPLLMSIWREAFAVRGTPVSQILLSRTDFDSRRRFLNIRNCVHALHQMGAVPIVNENDTVATEEISLGDNDVLAAKLAVAVQAEALIILTTGPGVLDAADELVLEAPDAEHLKQYIRPMKTSQGRGGMATKLEAARIAMQIGVTTVIAPGRPVEGFSKVMQGERIGTCIGGGASRRTGKREWISLSATPAGTVQIDAGAAAAVCSRGASLLAKGVVAITGRFEVGDVLSIRDQSGNELARGLANLSSEEVRAVMGLESTEFAKILGRQTHEEVVHRNNLVLAKASRDRTQSDSGGRSP